jgi:hypothetical protein
MLRTLQWTAVLAALVLFLTVAGIAYYSSPPTPPPKDQETYTEQQGEHNKIEQSPRRSGFIHFRFPDSISIFTFWLVIATIALAAVAILQIGFLARAEHIAAITANAAKKSAETGEAALTSVQRAFVDVDISIGLEAVRQPNNPTVADHWEFFIAWKNSGPTRAVDARQRIGITSDPNFVIPIEEIRGKY